MGTLFGIIFVLLFWWALFLGFRAVARRLLGAFGRMLTGDWSFSEQRRLSRAVDDDQPVTIDGLSDDMEATLARLRMEASELIERSTGRQALLADAEAAVADWDDKARLAVDKGRDDLARAALTERDRADQHAAALRDELAHVDQLLAGYRTDIRGLQGRLDEIERRRIMAESRIDRAESGARTRELLGEKWDEALPGLTSLDRAADLAEARLEVLGLGEQRTFGRRAAPPVAPLDPRVERELEAMKARLTTPPPERSASG